MAHPNATLLEKFYSDLQRGDFQSALALCDDKVTFQAAGKSPVAGKFDKQTFARDFIGKLKELSGGTLSTEVHDILASDRHGVVLLTDRISRGGKATEFRMVHVWRFESGKPVAWYQYARDLYQFDALWS